MSMPVRSCFVLWVALVACGDERGGPSAPAPTSTPTAAPQIAKAPAKPIDLSLGDGYAMRHPIHDGRLTLIPIVATANVAASDYLTLNDGMARHLVTVRELPSWQVDTVRIRNKSSQPLFVMSGELITDGKQDRVLAEDRVIMPKTTLEIHVRCVEQHRENGSSVFHGGRALAELALRELVVHRTQTDVWNQVDVINTRLGLTPASKTYRLAAQQQPAARRDAVIAQLAQQPDRQNMVGLAAAIDGKIVALERFASPALYQQLESEIIGAYVASDSGQPHEGHTLLPDDVRALATAPGAAITTTASFIALRSPDAPEPSSDPWAPTQNR